MKVLRLDLIAFGPFTDQSLDLTAGREGLHIVYGPNEAGKSAALRALRALFFGIPVRTADNFVHENKALRIGGRIRNADSELALVRRKGAKNTLMNCADEPLPDDVLSPYLGAVEEEVFSRVFGISHEDLVRGGEDLVAGGGEAGESLFAAAVGGGDLHRVLAGLEGEADELFRPRATTKVINREIVRYREACRAAAQACLSIREWETHRNALEQATAERAQLAERLQDLRVTRNRLQRIGEALPTIAELAELRLKREGMGEVQLLRPSFAAERQEAEKERERAVSTEQKAREDAARLEERRARITLPEGLLEQEEIITEFHQRLGSHRKAARDLPVLEGELGQLRADARALLRELRPESATQETATRGDSEAIRVSSTQRARIRELAAANARLLQARANAERQARGQRTKVARVRSELEGLGEPLDPAELKAALERSQRHGDLEGDLAAARSELMAAEDRVAVSLGRLPLWTGSVEGLEAIPLPAESTLDRFEAALDGARGEVERGEDRLRQLGKTAGDSERQLGALALAGEVPTETGLQAARERRNCGWRLIRRAWLEGQEDPDQIRAFAPGTTLADAYEGAVETADGVADRLRREADRVTRQATLLAELEATRAERERAETELGALCKARDVVAEEWRAVWSAVDFEPLPPRETRSWIQQVAGLRELAQVAKERRLSVARLEQRVQGCRDELGAALEGLGLAAPDLPLQRLLERAKTHLDRLEEERRRDATLGRNLKELADELAQAEAEVRAADTNLARWGKDWAEALTEAGLEITTTPAAAEGFLDRSQQLAQKHDQAESLSLRIAAIRREADEFVAEVGALARQLGAEWRDIAAEQVVGRLHARLGKTREDAATRAQLQQQLEEKREVAAAAQDVIRDTTERLNALTIEAGCTGWDELEGIERRSDLARDLDRRMGQVEERLLAHSGGEPLGELLRAAGEADADLLPEQIRALEREIEALEERFSAIEQTIGSENNELQRMDGSGAAAEAAESAQGILAQVREGAERYVRLRLASFVLRREIERYRTKNQGPLLDRASHLFAHLTRGSFTGLKTEYDDRDVPLLVGLRPTGATVGVAGMSEGSRDQLYLALRLATLERHFERSEPLPFIIDDVLINFDDERATATLEVLAELSTRTQIIFFTHHAHLLDLAKQAVDPAVLHLHSIGGSELERNEFIANTR